MTYTEQAIRICNFCKTEYKLNKNYSAKQILRSKFCSCLCQQKGRTRTKFEPPNKGKKTAVPRKCDECSRVNEKVTFYKKYGKLLCANHYYHYKIHGKALWGDERPYRTPEPKRQRGLLEQIEWRKAVFQRDNFTCQMCGERGGKLQADHIKPFKYFPELRTTLSNGRTLCEPCHKQTPTWGRKGQKLYAHII